MHVSQELSGNLLYMCTRVLLTHTHPLAKQDHRTARSHVWDLHRTTHRDRRTANPAAGGAGCPSRAQSSSHPSRIVSGEPMYSDALLYVGNV